MALPLLCLKPNADKRLKAGHLWVYSNEIDVAKSPLSSFESGCQAVVTNSQGKSLGIAMVNPNALICGRLIGYDTKIQLDKSLLVHRMNIAMGLRDSAFDKPFYRMVYGDSDLLSGLIIDRFDDICVVQIGSAGMEAHKADIVEALIKVVNPTGILFKNDSQFREVEGLEKYSEVAFGEVPDLVPLEENQTQFMAPVKEGQKTGWFYDHRMGRQTLQRYAKDARVLDVFSYVGAWGIEAMAAGAKELVAIDSSEFALDVLVENAGLNGIEEVGVMKGQANDMLKELAESKEKFDIVIVDPPAFIKRRKDIRAGERAYRKVNELALRLLNQGGLLVSGSCSMHLKRESLIDVVRGAGRHIDRHTQIIEQSAQGADHPIHPAIPETEYLKSVFVRSLRL